jgi:putative transposase
MARRRTEEQIRHLLRQVKRDLAKGLTILDSCRRHGIVAKTYYRWRDRFEAADQDGSRRARQLQAEVDRLKLLVAELMLDKQILQEAAKKLGRQT